MFFRYTGGMKQNKLKIHKQIEAVIERAYEEESFREDLAGLRAFSNLPKRKLKKPKTVEEHQYYMDKYIHNNRTVEDYRQVYYRIRGKFAKKYGLIYFGSALDYLILYDDISLVYKLGDSGYSGVHDLNTLLNYSAPGSKPDKEVVYNLLTLIQITNPTIILLHPHMNETDILNLVRSTYKSQIEPIQKKYQKYSSRLGKKRKVNLKSKEKRKYIFKHQGLPIKDLTAEVNKKFNTTHDYTYIQKILRDEKKRK